MNGEKRQPTPGRITGEEFANPHHGPEGVDKAPGEETSEDIENVIADTQKGKNEVDSDLSKESDLPIERE